MFFNHGTHEVDEDEFESLTYHRNDTICWEYDSSSGKFLEYGIPVDDEDLETVGRPFLFDFIASGKDIIYGRNDDLDANYEITRS